MTIEKMTIVMMEKMTIMMMMSITRGRRGLAAARTGEGFEDDDDDDDDDGEAR